MKYQLQVTATAPYCVFSEFVLQCLFINLFIVCSTTTATTSTPPPTVGLGGFTSSAAGASGATNTQTNAATGDHNAYVVFVACLLSFIYFSD